MDQRLVTHLEASFALRELPEAEVRDAVLMGLTWPTEYWAGLAIGWLEQGAPLDAELAAALEAIISKPFSQGVRHRARALARQWQRTQSVPNPSFKRTPDRAA